MIDIQKKILVSIMIPTFNQPNYIKRAIDSALNQTYSNIEIIISDDSSNNETEEIVKSYKDKRIRYFHNIPRKGRVNNYRYMLYNLARGEWVINLDGDDYFIDNKFIEESVKLINKYSDVVAVIGRMRIFYENENRYIDTIFNFDEKYKVVDGNDLFFKVVFNNVDIPHLAALYNREKAIKVGFYEKDILSSDRLSLMKLFVANRVILYNKVVGVWVHHGKNTSQTKNLDEVFKNLIMYDELFNFSKNKLNIIKLLIFKLLGKYKMLYPIFYEFLINKDYKNLKIFVKKLLNYNFIYLMFILGDVRLYKRLFKKGFK